MARVIAARLSALVRDLPAVVLNAAPEYGTREIAVALAEQRFTDGYTELFGDEARPVRALEELRSGHPVLTEIDVEKCDHDWAEIMEQEPPTATQSSLRVIIICDGADSSCCAELEQHGYLVLDHRDLILSNGELAQLLPEDRRGHRQVGRLAHLTGGIAQLVAASGDEADQATPELAELAQAWANRVYPQLADDPLVRLHAWLGTLSPTSVAVLATPLLGRRPTSEEVRAARQHELIANQGMGRYAMPGVLARAVRRAAAERDPQDVEAIEQNLINQAVENPELPRIAAVKLLLYLWAWGPLDHVLANSLHLGAHLNAPERAMVLERWPAEVPRQWPYLARLRNFCRESHDWTDGQIELVLAEVRRYFDLMADVDASGSTLMQGVRQWAETVLNPRMKISQQTCVQRVIVFTEWLVGEMRKLEAAPALPNTDDLALLFAMQGTVARLAVAFGEIGSALTISRVTKTLMAMVDTEYELFASMSCWAAAMNAMTAAAAGLPQLATAHLGDFDRLSREVNFDEVPTSWFTDFARRMVAVYQGEVIRHPKACATTHAMVITPLIVHTEALEVLLLNGPQAATDWLQTALNRASWSQSPSWLWWPAEHVMILLHAQAGRVGAAQAWLGRVELPAALATVVRANVDFAAGRLSAAMRGADSVLALGNLPHSWHLLALGVKLACLANDEQRADERLALLASEDWSMALGVVATFPAPAQVLVTALLPAAMVKGLPGLQPAEIEEASTAEVRLTQRQSEVLAQLATSATMPEIAKRMYVSPETVRSTAKHLYRRMGVNDRQAAVDLGRALGLI